MKHVIFVMIFALISLVGSAQDRIIKKTGDVLDVRIVEVGDDYVKYKLTDSPEGQLYNIKKSEILIIKYGSSGRIEDFYSGKDFKSGDTNKYLYRDLKYRELKKIYDRREYFPHYDDLYKPGVAGIASFFIPGLGECICGEWGRGIGFFAGHVVLMAGTTVAYNYYEGLALVGLAACLALDIFSIVDAVHVAKVKNMYYRDIREHSYVSFSVLPSLNYVKTGNNMELATGLTFALTF